jgi:hypothetical protein
MSENDDVKKPSTDVNTGGGAYVGGNITVSGGGFVGRDQIEITGNGNVIGDHSRATVIKSEAGVTTDDFLEVLNELQRELSSVELDQDITLAIEADLQVVETQARRPEINRELLLLKLNSVVEMLEMSTDVSGVGEHVLPLAQEALTKGRRLST